MKYQLFTYRRDDAPRAGIVVADAWFDLADTAHTAGRPHLVANASVDAILANWSRAHSALGELAAQVAADAGAFASGKLEPGSLQLLSPVTRPGVIYAAGANYRDHVEIAGRMINVKVSLDPKKEGIPPWHFTKAGAGTLAGHRGDVPYPANTTKLDWEAELAVVIGRRASKVSVDDALDHVAGYMCANDLSARDHLARANVDASSPFRFDWLEHKSFNGSCPLGPVFTPAEFVGSPENLDIKLWVNGELRQNSNTSNHLYGVADQIAYLSQRMDLLPGDIILTGTPAGTGMESGNFLKRGDLMKVWIAGLGELETRIV